MTRFLFGATAFATLALAGPAPAADIVRTTAPGATIPIAQAVSVPADYDLVFLSGATATLPTPATPTVKH